MSYDNRRATLDDVMSSSPPHSPASRASQLITPDDYPDWVPGVLFLGDNVHSGDGVTVRGFRYGEHDVVLPPVRDYLVVAYQQGTANMRRRFDGRWSHETLGRGDVTLLTRAAESRWTWREEIDVVHVHLTQDLMRSVCRQMYEREIEEVSLRDELRADDPVVFRAAMMLAAETAHAEAGSELVVESLGCQLAVHLLRRHTELKFREVYPQHGMQDRLLWLVSEYVDAHLRESISLQDLAGVVNLSRYHFARRFREATGQTPHEFVTRRRVERAQRLLARSRWMTLSEIAGACGFSDQSHMTRVFRKRLAVTPGQFRAENR
ncbi:AraC family transcriptional regulator [Nocardia sp. NPDC050713]|uniref:AraC family transcriptional regulator n=1 Tax=Nocardia sp. NPDC050713 TaxID=3154511 RepID=UPI0033E76914